MGTLKNPTTTELQQGSLSPCSFAELCDGERPRSIEARDGRDEMNLVELPLSGISDRFLDGRKTVVFTDEIWDRTLAQRVERKLAISGSDRYGLPTARDEDVLLACVQLSSADDFRSREVRFSRYELLKLLRWPDESKYYHRLATSLRRWKGVTIYSNRAFYDHAQKSWVNRDFGLIDNLYIYEREQGIGVATNINSWFVWNEVLYASFQAGYLKKLDWDLYCRLTDPVAKRLYRLLDKRFYHASEVTIDLKQLAFRKIRMSDRYNTAQIKRALANGIRELEAAWDLKPLPMDRRFLKRGRGQWEVVFQRRKPPSTKAAVARQEARAIDLATELSRRGIGPAMADELVMQQSESTVRTMLDLFDWYRTRGQEKGPGFLVDSIRNPAKYRLPREFTAESRTVGKRPERVHRTRHDANTPQPTTPAVDRVDSGEFNSFWAKLSSDEQIAFEAAALKSAPAIKRDGYHRSQRTSGGAFEGYRQVILKDHFERTQSALACTSDRGA